ncbi:MAG TPA: hypothetical protein VLC98_16850 [Phnomibacter sp.]|nr:hypothetical protein [Phnomibacter sp.]
MSSHKTFHFTNDGLEQPISLKINTHDHYVRIASPFHDIIHLRHQLFKASQVVVSNAYGAKLFNLQMAPNHQGQWLIANPGMPTLKLSFSHAEPTLARLDDGVHGELLFHLVESEEPSELEKEMLGAALVACHLQKQFTQQPSIVHVA